MKIQPRRSLYRISTLVVLLLGTATSWYALTLPMGTWKSPGAGAWPLGLGLAMVVSAIILLVTERDPGDYEPFKLRTLLIAIGFGLMVGFIIIFSFVGLTIASLALCFAWLRWMAKESWLLSAVLSVILTAVFVVVFAVLLRVPMPHDPILALVTGGRF